MRPVNKGVDPGHKSDDYKDSLPELEKRLGTYCSYCEMPIIHVPEVEHISSKSRGGDRLTWKNLLLGCKYCNSRKNAKTDPENIDEYLWPDQDNTALAYSYDCGVPRIDQLSLLEVDPTGVFYKKAKALFDLVQLDHVPIGKEKDRRFKQRNEAYQIAKDTLSDWISVKSVPDDNTKRYQKLLIQTALLSGFFSVWMTVFADEPEIVQELIKKFPGTQKKYFDENGHVKPIMKMEDQDLEES